MIVINNPILTGLKQNVRFLVVPLFIRYLVVVNTTLNCRSKKNRFIKNTL